MYTPKDNPASHAAALLTLVFALGAFLLGGCSTLMPVTPPARVISLEHEQSPLEYYAWALTASEDELQVELYGLELMISATDPVISSVRKSIILGFSDLATDPTRLQAVTLLKETAQSGAPDLLSENYKIFGEVLLTLQQQRDELRAAADVNQRALKEIDALKSRNTELQQQIEEITSIERQIIERERQNSPDP